MPLPRESPSATSDDALIEIDTDQIILGNLLDILHASDGNYYFNDVVSARAVIELGERYQFHSLPRLMANSLYPLIAEEPGRQFNFASKHDLEAHAKACIPFFGEDVVWEDVRLANLPAQALQGVSTPYVAALVRAMAVTPEIKVEMKEWEIYELEFDADSDMEHLGTPPMKDKVDWEAVAKAFRILRE